MDKVAELESRQFKFSLKCVAIFWLGILSGLVIDNQKLIGWVDGFVEIKDQQVTVFNQPSRVSPSRSHTLRKLKLYGVTLTNLDCTDISCRAVLPLPSSRRSQESLVQIIKAVFTEYFNSPIELTIATENKVLTLDILVAEAKP